VGSPAIVGTAAQLSASSGTPSGEYILVTLPAKMCLKRYSWSGLTTQAPKEGEIWGSNDGSSWSPVHTFTDGNSGWVSAGSSTTDYGNYPDHRDVGEGNVAFYSRYAFIITKLAGGDIAASMRDLQYFGTPEYDPEAHGTDVTVKSYPNVPNTDWLELHYDAENYSGVGDVQDETSNNRDATLDGVVYDSVSKSFTFDGDDKIYTSAMSYTPTSNYTASLWFKVSEFRSNQSILFQFGHGSGGESFGMNVQNGDLAAYVYGGSTRRTQADIYSVDEWVHATCIANSDGTVEIYFNGRLVLFDDAGQALTIPSNPYLSLGLHFSGEISSWQSTLNCLKGSIANFRLFNRALSSDEIYQLYAYQKEDFGHSTNNMTLKAGRLGIGTSEPRAALDVRGDIIGGMPVFFDVRFTSAPTATYAGSRIVFDTINNSRGGGFDKSTGTFTAPIAGQYKFSYFMRGNIVNQGIKIKPRINGSPTFNTTNDGTNQNLLGSAFCGNDGLSGSAVCIVSLEVGGTFDLHACSHGSTVTSSLSNFYNGFTGEYISSL
jgi:hypothetical protein